MKKISVIDLSAVPVREVMKKDVVSLQTDDPISRAIEVFEEYHISGAPVVDGAGRAVGVLSAADVARGDHVSSGQIRSERHEYYLANPLDELWDEDGDESIFAKEDYSGMVAGAERVSDWMTPRVISVDPDASLRDVCKLMKEERIHRVLVTEENAVQGILSTYDIVTFFADHS